jgi:hypothetical protein
MLYTQIENNKAKYLAVTIEGLVILNVISNITATAEQLAQANVVQVTMLSGQVPVDGYEYELEIKQQSNGSWAQELVKKEISEEQYQNNVAVQVQAVKADRNRMLAGTDWIVAKSIESGNSVPDNWKIYRQALRDIPTQESYPWTITWPTPPSE